MNNSAIICDREICSGRIEGVYFGPRVWVIARSPSAMLLWVYGHNYWSGRCQQSYARGHFTLLPDRSSRFMYQPRWKNFDIEGKMRADKLDAKARVEIDGSLGIAIGQGHLLDTAIIKRKTLILDGGGGQLRPLFPTVSAEIEWMKNRPFDPQFITLPEGTSMHDAMRHKMERRRKQLDH